MAILPTQVSPKDLEALADHTNRIVTELRNRSTLPDLRKAAPTVGTERLIELCGNGMTRDKLRHRIQSQGLPAGQTKSGNNRREYTIEEVHQWNAHCNPNRLRPANAKAATITTGFFKGGVGKSSTTFSLAQGLSLRGHRKILVVDLDPQGTLTTLAGVRPETEVEEEDTLVDFFSGTKEDVRYAIKETYWPGIDVIPSNASLFTAEFTLPARQMKKNVVEKIVVGPDGEPRKVTERVEFEFWNQLNLGLECVRDKYDVILVDTPPALSYVTLNAFYAADGLIVPVTPSMLDVASSGQFWSLFAHFSQEIDRMNREKELKLHGSVPDDFRGRNFDFIHVLMNQVDARNPAAAAITETVRRVLTAIYADRLLPIDLPRTEAVKVAAAHFSTVYDVYAGSQRMLQKSIEAYDRLVELIEASISQVWSRQIADQGRGDR